VISLSKLHPDAVNRFDGLVDKLRTASRTLDGGPRGGSVYERLELQPGFEQLRHHLDRALHWAEEMKLIIAEELS